MAEDAEPLLSGDVQTCSLFPPLTHTWVLESRKLECDYVLRQRAAAPYLLGRGCSWGQGSPRGNNTLADLCCRDRRAASREGDRGSVQEHLRSSP